MHVIAAAANNLHISLLTMRHINLPVALINMNKRSPFNTALHAVGIVDNTLSPNDRANVKRVLSLEHACRHNEDVAKFTTSSRSMK